jgi:hypothetical protein
MAETKAAVTYPVILSNINVKAQIVWSAEQQAMYGDGWEVLDLASQGLALTPAP